MKDYVELDVTFNKDVCIDDNDEEGDVDVTDLKNSRRLVKCASGSEDGPTWVSLRI